MRRLSRPLRPRPSRKLLLPLRQLPPIQRAIEKLQRRHGLVVRDLVAGLVNARKGEIAVLARLPVLDPVDQQGRVPGCGKLLAVDVLGCERDGFAAEPVADVVCIAVDQGDADGSREDVFKVSEEVWPDEVACLLEGVVDFVVGLGVVYVDAERVEDCVVCEVVEVVAWWCWVFGWVADVVGTPVAERVVWGFWGC